MRLCVHPVPFANVDELMSSNTISWLADYSLSYSKMQCLTGYSNRAISRRVLLPGCPAAFRPRLHQSWMEADLHTFEPRRGRFRSLVETFNNIVPPSLFSTIPQLRLKLSHCLRPGTESVHACGGLWASIGRAVGSTPARSKISREPQRAA